MFVTFRRFWNNMLICLNLKNFEVADGEAGDFKQKIYFELAAQIVVTVVVLSFAIYVLADKNSQSSSREFASGWVGIVLGYWFR